MDNNKVTFVVDKQNGVCVAEIDHVTLDAEDVLNDRIIPCVTSGFRVHNSFISKYDMNYKYKAVAKLHPDDTWDEERGKKIANDKLTERYHNSIDKRLAEYASDFRKIADNIDKYLADRHFERNN